MPPNYRQQRGAPLLAHERRAGAFLAALLVATGVGAGCWELASGGGAPPGKCVSVVVASSTGGSELRHCGATARTWCAGEARSIGTVAAEAQAACRRAGLLDER